MSTRSSSFFVFLQLQQQQSRLMKINHDLRHKISVVEAQGKALIEQKVELEASAQARGQEVNALRQEITRLRERLHGELPTQNPEDPPPQLPSPAEVNLAGRIWPPSLEYEKCELRRQHFLLLFINTFQPFVNRHRYSSNCCHLVSVSDVLMNRW